MTSKCRSVGLSVHRRRKWKEMNNKWRQSGRIFWTPRFLFFPIPSFLSCLFPSHKRVYRITETSRKMTPQLWLWLDHSWCSFARENKKTSTHMCQCVNIVPCVRIIRCTKGNLELGESRTQSLKLPAKWWRDRSAQVAHKIHSMAHSLSFTCLLSLLIN